MVVLPPTNISLNYKIRTRKEFDTFLQLSENLQNQKENSLEENHADCFLLKHSIVRFHHMDGIGMTKLSYYPLANTLVWSFCSLKGEF